MNKDLRKLEENESKYTYTNRRLKLISSRQRSVGYSLVEMLVVIFVFSVLGVVSTRILAISLRGTKKGESIGEVRTNLEYSISTMERLLRNATSINATSCPSTGSNELDYKDENDEYGRFECDSANGFIASGSGALAVPITSDSVLIDCTGTVFTCPSPAYGVPQTVIIQLTGEDAELGSGVEGSSVTVRTQIQLRNY